MRVSYRRPCVIDDGNTALLIGGSKTGCCNFKTVERYDSSGLLETLVSLNLERNSLACGKYQNNYGKKVTCWTYMIEIYHINISNINLDHIKRCPI